MSIFFFWSIDTQCICCFLFDFCTLGLSFFAFPRRKSLQAVFIFSHPRLYPLETKSCGSLRHILGSAPWKPLRNTSHGNHAKSHLSMNHGKTRHPLKLTPFWPGISTGFERGTLSTCSSTDFFSFWACAALAKAFEGNEFRQNPRGCGLNSSGAAPLGIF